MSNDGEIMIELLRHGRNNVRSSYALAEELGVPQRTVGFAVNRLRKAGHLIGSVHGEGYYLIDTPEELAETIEHIEKRKAGIDATVASLRASFRKVCA